MLRGALIGCGFFAANHLSAWRDVDGAEIVALCAAGFAGPICDLRWVEPDVIQADLAGVTTGPTQDG